MKKPEKPLIISTACQGVIAGATDVECRVMPTLVRLFSLREAIALTGSVSYFASLQGPYPGKRLPLIVQSVSSTGRKLQPTKSENQSFKTYSFRLSKHL